MSPFLPLALFTATLAASPEAPPDLHAGSFGVGVMVQTAIPTGLLARDVHAQWGFGLAAFTTHGLSDRILLRPTFSWTGYRLNERNWGNRFLANLLDADAEDESLVLRSLQLGVDLVVHRDPGGQGPYLFVGGGLQRSRLSLEYSFTDRSGEEDRATSHTLADWEPLSTPYLQAGLGVQWKVLFAEAKVVGWRYRAAPGLRLEDTPLQGAKGRRDALSVVMAGGLRF